MAVTTAALKTFAPAMRRQLMEAVGRKLDLLLNSQTPDTLSTYAKQIAELRDEQEKSREQLLERVAYTWFNRLCALRYLDAKGWHPFGCKVLMPADSSETQPELLKLMRSGSLPADLKNFTNEQRLNQLLDGQIPTAIPGGDAQGEVYLVAPKNWIISPSKIPFNIAEKGEELDVVFSVQPPKNSEEVYIEARLADTGVKSLTEVAYDHIPKQYMYQTARQKLARVQVESRGERVAYIMGAGDEVPLAIEQLGYEVDLLEVKQIQKEMLRKYDAVVLLEGWIKDP